MIRYSLDDLFGSCEKCIKDKDYDSLSQILEILEKYKRSVNDNIFYSYLMKKSYEFMQTEDIQQFQKRIGLKK